MLCRTTTTTRCSNFIHYPRRRLLLLKHIAITGTLFVTSSRTVTTTTTVPTNFVVAFAAAFASSSSTTSSSSSSRTTKTTPSLLPVFRRQRRQRIETLSFLPSTFSSSTRLSMSTMSTPSSKFKFVDIGANLLDERYTKGEYFGKVKHEPDIDAVIQRSIDSGVSHIIITAGTLLESYQAIQLVKNLRTKQHDNKDSDGDDIKFGCTVGIHPTRCSQEFVNIAESNTVVVASKEEESDATESPTIISLPTPPQIPSTAEDVLNALLQLAIDDGNDTSCVVALGEIGLDYDRLQFCSKEIQHEYLQKQLDIFDSNPHLHNLPLFLHNRNCGTDLLDILKNRSRRSTPYTGVVHSYDDTIELAQSFIDMGLYIGINGCSLKTDENLQVIKELPLTSILLETDCPYCEIKNTHSSMKYLTEISKFDPSFKKADKKFEMGKMVKGRNEPNHIIQVAEVIAGVKGISLEQVATTCYENSMKLYTKFNT